jgi:putative sugar O-methyltransferase
VCDNARFAYRLSRVPKTYKSREYLSLREEVLTEYHGLQKQLESDAHLVHPAWRKFRDEFRAALEEGLPERFLDLPVLAMNMVRRGDHEVQAHEEDYLRSCSGLAAEKIEAIQETYSGCPRIEVPNRGWSATTLGHAYYLARIIDLLGIKREGEMGTILEFGGGYGNLCRIFKQVTRNRTYIIVDLPEFLALQMLFLRLSLPSEAVRFIASAGQDITPGAINLVPVVLWEHIKTEPDMFVSTFALSESPAEVQQSAIENRFYRARAVYIVGQHKIDGMQTEAIWERLGVETPWQHSTLLIEGVRSCYEKVDVTAFHVGDNYELAAISPK